MRMKFYTSRNAQAEGQEQEHAEKDDTAFWWKSHFSGNYTFTAILVIIFMVFLPSFFQLSIL